MAIEIKITDVDGNVETGLIHSTKNLTAKTLLMVINHLLIAIETFPVSIETKITYVKICKNCGRKIKR